MFQLLIEQKVLTAVILSLLLLSIVCQIIIGVIYQKLIHKAENLSITENKQLKQFKLKFQNCYQMNGDVPNIAVFVDKFISNLSVSFFSLSGLRQIASQLIMLFVFLSGIGACLGIIAGEVLLHILPYYFLGIAGLYLYFSVSSLVDIQRRKENLKINLMDYLENHMVNRLKNNKEEEEEKEQRENKEKPMIQEFAKIQERKEAAGEEAKEEKPRKPMGEGNVREKELKAVIAAFSEDEIEDLLKELMA